MHAKIIQYDFPPFELGHQKVFVVEQLQDDLQDNQRFHQEAKNERKLIFFSRFKLTD